MMMMMVMMVLVQALVREYKLLRLSFEGSQLALSVLRFALPGVL
jgi:hypothetical protein